MFKNHFMHFQHSIKIFLHILPLSKMVQCVKIDLYSRHMMEEKTYFMHRIVQKILYFYHNNGFVVTAILLALQLRKLL